MARQSGQIRGLDELRADSMDLRAPGAEPRERARWEAEQRRLRADSDAIERRIVREHQVALRRDGLGGS